MSFSSDVKEELSKLNTLSKIELVKAELSGYLITVNASINKSRIRFSTESQYNINRFHKLLNKLSIDYDIQFQGKSFVIEFSYSAVEEFILMKDQVIVLKKVIIENMLEDILKAIVRGVYLGAGSLNNPNHTYHLEMILNNVINANYIFSIVNHFGINGKILKRKKGYSLYFKDGEEISMLLAFIGAGNSVLKYEEIRVEKETRNNINRIINCETANLNKTINASMKQINDIEVINKFHKFNDLSKPLQEIANLRLNNPDASLIELGQMLQKPIGKSGVNHRLNKLAEIAENLRKGY